MKVDQKHAMNVWIGTEMENVCLVALLRSWKKTQTYSRIDCIFACVHSDKTYKSICVILYQRNEIQIHIDCWLSNKQF